MGTRTSSFETFRRFINTNCFGVWTQLNLWLKFPSRGLPWGLSDEEATFASIGDTGLIPATGGPHVPQSNEARAPQLLSLCSRAQELQLLSPKAVATEANAPWSPWSTAREATAMRSAHTTNRITTARWNYRKAHLAMKIQHSQK